MKSPLTEAQFQKSFLPWLAGVVEDWKQSDRARDCEGAQIDRLAVVRGQRVDSGHIGWYRDEKKGAWNDWVWRPFPREIDVAVAVQVTIDQSPVLIPLIAIELKTGNALSTDVIDMKSSIYGRLHDLYPFCLTALVISNYGRRRDYATLVRNARTFDKVFAEFSFQKNSSSSRILRDAIHHHLDYALWYHQM